MVTDVVALITSTASLDEVDDVVWVTSKVVTVTDLKRVSDLLEKGFFFTGDRQAFAKGLSLVGDDSWPWAFSIVTLRFVVAVAEQRRHLATTLFKGAFSAEHLAAAPFKEAFGSGHLAAAPLAGLNWWHWAWCSRSSVI